jgi:hypothetical protein
VAFLEFLISDHFASPFSPPFVQPAGGAVDLSRRPLARQRPVVGETPNLAARLQALAVSASLVTAAGTRQEIGELFDLEDLGLRQLAGFAEQQPVWRDLAESSEVAGRGHRHSRRLSSYHQGPLPGVGGEAFRPGQTTMLI